MARAVAFLESAPGLSGKSDKRQQLREGCGFLPGESEGLPGDAFDG